MEKIPDVELIDKALSGDADSFAALADRHYMMVYKFAFTWCRSREDAEDIAQEVFLKLADKLHLFDKRSLFTTWLYRITANCAKDYIRKNNIWMKNKHPSPIENGFAASPNPGPENHVIAKSILRVIDALPNKLKEAMLLVYGQDMSHKEAAQVAGCAETTISWRIFKAKRKLRKVLS